MIDSTAEIQILYFFSSRKPLHLLRFPIMLLPYPPAFAFCYRSLPPAGDFPWMHLCPPVHPYPHERGGFGIGYDTCVHARPVFIRCSELRSNLCQQDRMTLKSQRKGLHFGGVCNGRCVHEGRSITIECASWREK